MRVESDCAELPSAELIRGIEQFNAGAWFDCHETLEDIWIGAPGVVRDFYQGILQVAVALHHWREGNYKGAVLLMGSGARLLGHVAPVCQGINVTGLIRDTDRIREALEALGPERMTELDPELIPRIHFS
jgi:predicted metal-dependent hydrolase